MNNHNQRPLTLRKKVQLLLALTILAWATQTLLAQWTKAGEVGAEPAAAFVPRDKVPAGGTLELRAEARVYGGEVKLRQVCRWSEQDAATFAPLADLVLTKLEPRRPYKVVEIRDVKLMLEEAGINVAFVRFSGPVECTVSRSDSELNEGEALQEWVNAHGGETVGTPSTQPAKTQAADTAVADVNQPVVRTLRDLLVSDLSVRLSLPQDQLVLTFDPRDEPALNLPEAQFKIHIQSKR